MIPKVIKDIFTLNDDQTYDHTRIYFFLCLCFTFGFQWYALKQGQIFHVGEFGSAIAGETGLFGVHMGINSLSGNR